MNPRFARMGVTIFERMSALARDHKAVNLGQGFPDFGWTEDVVARAAEALVTGSNQYPPMRGIAELRQAVCDHYAMHQQIHYGPDQVIVTSGATEALAASILALVSPGDEVLLFEPMFDTYLPVVRQCGGVPKFARLGPPEWRINADLIDRAFSDKTRLVIFNTPHNPTARAFDREELLLLAEACVRHDAIAISDEVWEHVMFDRRPHLALASIPGMADRTVKIGSGGKMFSMTGWKVGWSVAPPPIAAAIANAHQFLTFTTAPHLQAAVAYGLGKERAYFDIMRAGFADARDFFLSGLEGAGFAFMPVEGTYFVCVNLAASGIPLDDATFCERAVREAGVAAIPLSAFYDADPVGHIIRLCFAKSRDTLHAGIERLKEARRMTAS